MIDHPLTQLTLVRFREFMREPEAVFWVFVFPLLLAAGLGLAFRNTPAEVLNVAVVGDWKAFEPAPAGFVRGVYRGRVGLVEVGAVASELSVATCVVGCTVSARGSA